MLHPIFEEILKPFTKGIEPAEQAKADTEQNDKEAPENENTELFYFCSHMVKENRQD